MKNISLILNIVLLVAVVVLYVLHFSQKPASSPTSDKAGTVSNDLKIAYVNSDTILKYYDFLQANKKQLEEKTKKFDQDMRNRLQGLQGEFEAYQRNVNSMTLGQVRSTEENLAKKQQNLELYKQRLTQEVLADEARLNKELYDRVTSYLEEYGKEKGLQVVFKFDQTSDLLHVNESLDISKDVVEGLNRKYAAEQTGGADSTAVAK